MAYSIQLEHDSLLLFIYHMRKKNSYTSKISFEAVHACCLYCIWWHNIVLFTTFSFSSFYYILYMYIVKKKRLYKVFCSTSVKIIFVNKVTLSVEYGIVNTALKAGALLLFGGRSGADVSCWREGVWLSKVSKVGTGGSQGGAEMPCWWLGYAHFICSEKRLQPALAQVCGP